MRKLKLQVQISVDGFIGGSNGEMDFITFQWTDDINTYVTKLTQGVGTILLGRKLAQGFIPHWQSVASDPGNPEVAAGRTFTDLPKVVFSRTLRESPWPNTELAVGSLAQVVNALKQKDGKGDLIAYGGAEFVSSLINEDLIDEYHLFVNPSVLGEGMSIFRKRMNLQLVTSQTFDCGIVLLVYRKKE